MDIVVILFAVNLAGILSANGQPEVEVTETTSTTVSLRVLNPGYRVTYADHVQDFSSDGSRLLVVENLAPNSTYSFQIQEKINYGLGSTATVTATTTRAELAVPGPPEVSIFMETPTTVTLLVESPLDDGGAPVDGYDVAYDGVVLNYGINEVIFIQNLRPSTRYHFSVSARNNIGSGQPAAIIVTTQNVNVPSPPKIVSDPHANSSDTYTIEWEMIENGGLPVKEYTVRYRQVEFSGGFIRKPLSDWVSRRVRGDQLTYTATNLKGGLHYQAEVSARNDMGMSMHPSQFVFITESDKDTPGPPQEVAVYRMTPTTVTLQVEPPADMEVTQVTGYEVEYGVNRHVYAIGDAIVVRNLFPSTRYIFSVRAVNEIGSGEAAKISVRTMSIREPYPVTILSGPHAPTSDSYEITWETPEDGGLPIKQYVIKYRQVRVVNGEIERPLTDWIVRRVPGHRLSYTVNHLVSNTHYEVSVIARNDIGWSVPAHSIFGTP